MTKQRIAEKIEDIRDMGAKELEDFERVLAVSNIVGRARNFLIRAVEERKKDLKLRDGAGVVNGDIDDTDY